MNNFVVVSNRLPVTVSRQSDGTLAFSVSSGGLATAVSSLDIKAMIWVGWPGIDSDDLTTAERNQIKSTLAEHGCYPVFLTSQEVDLYYEGYSNDTLWPMFHYFPSYTQYNSTYWDYYKRVNKKFASAVKRVGSDDATIWVHDYQLMLLPKLIREIFHDAKIGYFHHIPFPSYELFRNIPERRAIIEGLLGADLVGFHVYDYVRHFMSSAQQILGATSTQGVIEYQSHHTNVDAFPIGIDYKKYRDNLSTKSVRDKVKALEERYKGQQLLLSVDRLDYSKGISKRLEAYEKLLEQHPRYIGKICMIMIQVPSRTEIDTYKRLRDDIEQTVGRINGRFGTVSWAPISYQFKGLPFDEIEALYVRADVALVTPLRDGMNLVAKEYVASKRNRRGVLVLSEMAGAADELVDALQVNPNDIPELTETIHHALTMPLKEQKERLKKMQARIGDYDVQAWGKDFLAELNKAHATHTNAKHKKLHAYDIESIVADYATAKSRLVLLDYDGTLHGHVKDISAKASRPSAALLKQLRTISSQRDTTVCIISGRPRAVLDEWFSSTQHIVLVAEHGAWVKEQGIWRQTVRSFDKSDISAAMEDHKSRTPGAQIEEKDFAMVWHYRRVNPELAYVRNGSLKRELILRTSGTDLGVYEGRQIIEVKPKSIDKGAITRKLLRRSKPSFVLVAGDDYTDEYMFRAVPYESYTVKIGSEATHARFQVSRHERVLSLIEQLSNTPVIARKPTRKPRVVKDVDIHIAKPLKRGLKKVKTSVAKLK